MNTQTVTPKAKRHYTKRGTTLVGVRTILLDGKPVGRGRPAKNGKGKRTVVFVPKGQTYNVAVHGLGTEYRASRHPVMRRLKAINKVVDLTPVTIDTPVGV